MQINHIFTITTNPGVDREWNIPSFEFNKVLRASESLIHVGGKGFNVSRMLKILGINTTAMGFVGGRAGEYLQEGLNLLGIKSDLVYIEEESRTNISIRNSNTGQYLKVNEDGPKITPQQQYQLIEKVSNSCSPNDLWILSGSLPPGISIDYYARLINIIQNKEAKVILDTSGEALHWGCKSLPYMIKPNHQELQELTKMPVTNNREIIDAGYSLIESGIKHILVSLGKNGAIFISKNANWLLESPKIAEHNPTGAGDALIGGFVWGLSMGYPIQDALRWGIASGAAAASLSGTAYGSLEQIKALYNETKSQEVVR
jgi:1-phosphofructokinase family hexose kinase